MRPPALDDGDVRIWHGDALETLREMPSESVQMIVTSPPFWGLRDYQTGSWVGGDEACDHQAKKWSANGRASSTLAGTPQNHENEGQGGTCSRCGATRVDQQIGLEETPDEWCARLVAVMREARRVLRMDGVCWIEVGDSYNGSHIAEGHGGSAKQRSNTGAASAAGYKAAPGVKPKDLVGAPWLLAFALRADGWYLRSDTIWARPNPMPESVTDRPTKAHSYVFLLTKSARYYYDADSIRETSLRAGERAGGDPMRGQQDNGHVKPSWGHAEVPAARNARSVWSIATEPTPFAHFATFPQALVERCIKAGTSEHGCCSECGAPWRRIVNVTGGTTGESWHKHEQDAERGGGQKAGGNDRGMGTYRREHLGWEPGCPCQPLTMTDWQRSTAADSGWYSYPVAPCVVLDPFSGSATTALVARRLGRHAVGIELNEDYLRISATRLQQLSLLGGTA